MQKYYLTFILFLILQPTFGQVVINELDCDSPGIDNMEFIEIKTATPKFPLDGYILVFFNGSSSGGNRSYFNIDLNGYETDLNGLLLIGSNSVSPVPQYLIPENTIQNGADGVGIYFSSIFNFPEGTLATDQNLIDALVYDTNDADVSSLMQLLNVSQQINEGQNGKKDTESIQRDNDGNYFVATPTPRQLNDGTGIVLNGISLSVSEYFPEEGSLIEITITSELNVENDQVFNISLFNTTFGPSDFTGDTSVLILQGVNTGSTMIQLLDDNEDEGDEEMKISLLEFPEAYLALNDNLIVRVVDNDFVIAPWGLPVDPSVGMVQSTGPADYYKALKDKAGPSLRQALQDIIADESIVRAQTYTDIIEILKMADQNPANSNEVWLVYSEVGKPKLDFQTSSDNTGKWNREHTFPRSRGGFYSIQADDEADGKDIYWNTNADSLRHGNSDAHALRAADGAENSNRGNQHYGQYNGPIGNLGSFKGDVARSVLYMDVRYNGLEVVNGFPSVQGQMGDLATLLDWHRNDPPDDFEMNRNNVIYEWQQNRNPFIDLPELVEYLWGNRVGDMWTGSVNISEVSTSKINVYPNPSFKEISIENLLGESIIRVFSNAVLIKEIVTRGNKEVILLDLLPGIYILQVDDTNGRHTRKIIIN